MLQQPRDTGRRDQELSAQRAQAAWAQARSLLASASLPWPLKQAWTAGRVLPAAYTTLANCTAVSLRAAAPLEGFFERTTRTLLQSWRYGHLLSKPCLYALAGLTAPAHAVVIARARHVTQLCRQAPVAVWEIFEACWNRATPANELLVDACRSLLPAVREAASPPVVTLRDVRRHLPALHKACKHLSRYGTLYWAFWELWRDVGLPKVRRVLGAIGDFVCPLCASHHPSYHALSAHIHRKHSVVNCLTRYTAGTVCLWCNCEHYTTDRLKYHLGRSPGCVHGLRVVVGEIYQYGSGSKRTGARGHRGLPPKRLPGPLNATPTQRNAALHFRQPDEHELRAELYAATGSSDIYAWPSAPPVPTVEQVTHSTGPAAVSPPTPPAAASATGVVWWRFVHSSDEEAHCSLSPFWPGLQRLTVCWGLPSRWHRFWRLWLAAQDFDTPWDWRARSAQGLLRRAEAEAPTNSGASVADLLAATVTLRQICACVALKGLLWIPGVPSAAGKVLLRKLLPLGVFSTVQSSSGTLFVVSHPDCKVPSGPCFSGDRVAPSSVSERGGLLRPSLVYRSRSLDSVS